MHDINAAKAPGTVTLYSDVRMRCIIYVGSFCTVVYTVALCLVLLSAPLQVYENRFRGHSAGQTVGVVREPLFFHNSSQNVLADASIPTHVRSADVEAPLHSDSEPLMRSTCSFS
jgi:hypothetical protein